MKELMMNKYIYIAPRSNFRAEIPHTPLDVMMYNGFGLDGHRDITNLDYEERMAALYPKESGVKEYINNFKFYYNINDNYKKFLPNGELKVDRGIVCPELIYSCKNMALFIKNEVMQIIQKFDSAKRFRFFEIPRACFCAYDFDSTVKGFTYNSNSGNIPLASDFGKGKRLNVTSSGLYDGSFIVTHSSKYSVQVPDDLVYYQWFFHDYGDGYLYRNGDSDVLVNSERFKTNNWLLKEFKSDLALPSYFLAPKDENEQQMFVIKAGSGVIFSERIFALVDEFLPDFFFNKIVIE